MAWPKWMYRKHPALGHFDRTLVADDAAFQTLLTEGAEQLKTAAGAGTQWSEEAASHGFEVRPATLMHALHITPNHREAPLHELVPQAETEPRQVAQASIATVGAGDKHA